MFFERRNDKLLNNFLHGMNVINLLLYSFVGLIQCIEYVE